MEMRLQESANDTVLEISETRVVKRSLSRKALLATKQRIEGQLAKYQARLNDVEESLALIANAKHEGGTR